MKMKTVFIVLILILHFNTNASTQTMGDLYKYIIEDHYDEYIKEGYISEQDTMYFIWCVYDCDNECIEYNIPLNNDKIKLGTPEVSKAENEHFAVEMIRLTMPELERQFITISLVPYWVTYNKKTEEIGDLQAVRASTIIYKFEYNKKKGKYIFESKKEYAI